MKGRNHFTNRAKAPLAGCGTCGSKCSIAKQMETFPPELAQRLSNFSTSLLEFARLCHSKSQGGQFSVDSQILESLKALQEKVVEFQGEAHMYPELPNTLIHLLEKHGNPLVKQAFLK